MLAAHRDQENLVHSHQVPPKQQLKTPGARYPKTPSRFTQNDENAPTAFGGKTGVGGAKQTAMKLNGTRQAIVTPMGTRSRAPLGNKTTNAKAKAGAAGSVKGIVKEIEKSQLRPTAQKPKQINIAPLEFQVKAEQKAAEEEEPEYAPPKPKQLPYESDVFPKDLLTLEGLKSENLLKGYYQHFYNPVDEQGMSRQDREFQETMIKVIAKAEERNKHETDTLGWNSADIPEARESKSQASVVKKAPLKVQDRNTKKQLSKQPSTISSRRAASALSMRSDTSKGTDVSSIRAAKPRKPLSTMLQGKKPAATAKISHAGGVIRDAASRTTIGYTRGRTASSMVHSQADPTRPGRTKPVQPPNTSSDSITSPTRLQQTASEIQECRPQFMSLFDEDSDNEDLPLMSGPLPMSDDEEDEFQLKLDF